MFKACINEATTMTTDFETDVKAYSRAGFQAMELWLDKVTEYTRKNSVSEARLLLKENKIVPVAACGHMGILLGSRSLPKNMRLLEEKLSLCRELGVPTLVIAPEFPSTVRSSMYRDSVKNLRMASRISAKYDVNLGLEFIQGNRFISSLSTAACLVNKVGKKNVGIVFDTFHFLVGRSKTEDIDSLRKGQLLLVHINDAHDMPRELLTDEDRTFPGAGSFPLKEVLRSIKRTGYRGHLSLEMFDKAIWRTSPYRVARRAMTSLKEYVRI